MITQEIKITNRLGLHARPAAMVAQTAADFDCDIKIAKDRLEINAKSSIVVIMLAAQFCSMLKLCFDGKDEKSACEAITRLFAQNFNEEY